MKFTLTPLGFVHSCFDDKFAVPRQPGLAPSATGYIEMTSEFNNPDLLDGLEGCTHIWLQFIFHECLEKGWQPKVRPPRLGGNKKMGVLATRSTHRPNNLGLSVVELSRIDYQHKKIQIHVSGLDLINGTPVVDIKPYIPYSDSLTQAHCSFAPTPPVTVPVAFSEKLQSELKGQGIEGQQLKKLIIEVLQQDPRPAFHHPNTDRIYGAHLNKHNIQFKYVDTGIEVIDIQ